MRFFVAVLIAVSALVVTPASVVAQNQDEKLAALLPNLYYDAINAEFNAFVAVVPGVDVPLLEQSRQERLNVVYHVIDLAGAQLSSFPLGSASGGFSWTFDTASAAVTRGSDSFGPIFAERPLTIGRGRLNVGANYQRVTFDHLDGRRLRDGEIVGYFGQNLRTGFGLFFADSLDVTVTTDTLNAFATYGLTDRLDIGVAVPFNRVDLRATLTSRVGGTLTGVNENIEPFVTSRSGTATGLGDMVIRAKYNMLKREKVAIAESIDVRLPTGDEYDLLGVAGAQFKIMAVAATALGRLSPHINFAYTVTGTSSSADDPASVVVPPPDEINYVAGADLALSLRTTVAVDAVGRVLRGVGALSWGSSEFGQEFQQFHLNLGQDLHLLLGSVGLKVNPFGNMLLTTNVLFPLTKRGLTDNLTWMAGFDYSF